MRIFVISMALRHNFTVDEIHELTKIDRWFLYKLKNITDIHFRCLLTAILRIFRGFACRGRKKPVFQISRLQGYFAKIPVKSLTGYSLKVREYRKKTGVVPVVKQIDTLAAEFPAQTNYLYLTYHGTENDPIRKEGKKSVIVLGSGAYRIGSSVEFDWCSVNAVETIRKSGLAIGYDQLQPGNSQYRL
jgi:carbamoyl-phosphate synthase large subunit